MFPPCPPVIILISQFLLFSNVLAIPRGHKHTHRYHEDTFNLANETLFDLANVGLERRQTGDKLLLPLMPLGASITQGVQVGIDEIQQNGYRKLLRDHLRNRGYPVNMIGSRSHGTFKDCQHEGWPGLRIADVGDRMIPTLTRQKPNLVLINLGTNDCMQADDPNVGAIDFVRGAAQRLRFTLEKLFAESQGVTVILSTLLRTLDTSKDGYVQIVNTGIKDLILELQRQGRKIELADMYIPWFTNSDYSDQVHPNSEGYLKMAAIWAEAFARIEGRGWLTTPIDGVPDGGGQCYSSPDGFRGLIRTQPGSGYDDFNYRHSSVLESIGLDYLDIQPRSLVNNHFHFAELVKFEGEEHPFDEFIRVLDPEDRLEAEVEDQINLCCGWSNSNIELNSTRGRDRT